MPPLNSQEVCIKVSSQPFVGIIYPPPEVRNIIDKTASFVARNGPEFELRIRQNEVNNPKFNFLNQGDPYNTYYKHRIGEFKDGRVWDQTVVSESQKKAVAIALSTQLKQQELLKQAQVLLSKGPPPEFEYIVDPPSISPLNLETVKLTAQFVACNGRQFLTNLMNREQRNIQFDFLRPHHSLFQYFTKLLEQYTKILIPAKDMVLSLGMEDVLEQVKYRAEWLRFQSAQSRQQEELLEQERVVYAQIDWHDFVVVETVVYLVDEVGNFPPPTTSQQVGIRIIRQERIEEERKDEQKIDKGGDDQIFEDIPEADKELEEEHSSEEELGDNHLIREDGKDVKDNNQIEDMEEDSEDEEELAPPLVPTLMPPPSAFILPNPDTVIVKKGYDPKHAVQTNPPLSEEFLISPITGEKIPASKVQEHIKIGLLDPLWVKQRDKQIEDKLNQDSVFVPGSAISSSLKLLAERRTDIFGVGDEETGIGQKIGGEEKKQEKVTWDGHSSSVEAAKRAARANVTIKDQILQIHKVKGLLPDEEKERIGPKHMLCPPPPPPLTTTTRPRPVMVVPHMMGPPAMIPRPGPQFHMVPPPTMVPPFMQPVTAEVHRPHLLHNTDNATSEPAAKKLKTEESLVPEHVFLAQNQNPVTFAVAVPLMPERTEWNLRGQTLTVTVQLCDSVSVVKAKIQEATQLPPSKQKLQLEGMFFKDTSSLAFYNVSSATTIQLHLKERGGRKK